MSEKPTKPYFLYDGECPFCSQYAKFQAIREALPELQIISMRDQEAMSKVPLEGVTDLSQGMIFIDPEGRTFQGKEALVALSQHLKKDNLWNKTLRLGAIPTFAKLVYPAVFLARKVALCFKGVSSTIEHKD